MDTMNGLTVYKGGMEPLTQPPIPLPDSADEIHAPPPAHDATILDSRFNPQTKLLINSS